MNLDTNLLEQLSAYLDNELTAEEKDKLEDALQNSPSLREELQKLQAVRRRIGAIPPLQEDPYFETRFFQNLKDNQRRSFGFKLRKPVFLLASVSLVFMAIFKLQPDFFNTLLNRNQDSIKEFYAKNFKPLLFAASLSNDDILNFAVNKALPLNHEENQFLSLGFGKKGEQIIEVSTAGIRAPAAKSKTMANLLNLSGRERKSLDEILQRYNDKIATAVLVNDRNTVAVNAALWDYHAQLRSELLDFVVKANNPVLRELFPQEDFNDLLVINRKIAEPAATNQFYCISPDTIFLTPLNINKERLLADLSSQRSTSVHGLPSRERIRIRFDENSKLLGQGSINSPEMAVFNDENTCRIIIHSPRDVTHAYDETNELPRKMDSVFTQIRIYTYYDGQTEGGRSEIRYQAQQNGLRNGRPGYIPSITRGYRVDSLQSRSRTEHGDSFPKTEIWGRNLPPGKMLDSLHNLFRHYFNDSLAARYPKDLRRGMDEFREEFERMKKEFERFRENMKDEEQKKKFIEIQYHYDI